MGSYEYTPAGAVASLNLSTGSNQSIAVKNVYKIPLAVYVVDSQGSPVTGVSVTFTAPSTGPSGTFAPARTFATVLTNSGGLATAPAFTANTQSGSYNVTAKAAGLPGSISFALKNLGIPTLLYPIGNVINATTPTYSWTPINGATQYRHEIRDGGFTAIYSKIIPASACGATTCQNTATTLLNYYGSYFWRVQAMVNGVWQPYSEFKSFKVIFSPKAGLWKGPGLDFYVDPQQTRITNFSIYISVTGCGSYKITYRLTIPIVNQITYSTFSFWGAFYGDGTVSKTTQASGTLGLNYYHIKGCGYLKGGPFSWNASWKNATQPTAVIQETLTPILVEPLSGLSNDDGSYTVERVGP